MLICSTSKWYESLKDIQGIISEAYNTEIPRADLEIKKFADGELLPVFKDSVRNQDLIIIGSTEQPHDNLFELILIIDAARRASVNKITLLIPYMGYSRQDRRNGERCSHGSKTIANILENTGADHIITFDIHALQIDGNYNIPFDNITIDKVIGNTLKNKLLTIQNDIVLCSPDAGGVKRVELINHLLDDKYTIATILKKRIEANKIDSMQLIGDVKNKFVVICDDILDTGGTLCKAVQYLLDEGAVGVGAAITHGLLSRDADDNIAKSKLDFLILSSSTSNIKNKLNDVNNIQQHTIHKTELILSNVNGVIASIIYKLHNSMSLSSNIKI